MRVPLVLMAMALVMGVGAARAQMPDPVTGLMPDPPENYAAEAAAAWQAKSDAIDVEIAADQAQNDEMINNMMSNISGNQNNDASAVVVAPKVAKPAVALAGNQVSLDDKDAKATLHYTIDGKKPTAASAVYVGPFAVTGKTKVEVLAVDAPDRPSSVVKKTFKVK